MKIKVQVLIESDSGESELLREVVQLERGPLQPEQLGLTLCEAKAALEGIQQTMVEQQTAEYLAQQADCPDCGKRRRHKDSSRIPYRTLFGKLRLESPRLYHCDCRPRQHKSFSPLAELLAERTAPELLYMEAKFTSLISYGLSTKLFEELLPIGREINAATLRNHAMAVAERMEDELGDERFCFIEGCPRDWSSLPRPELPLTVGLDGGYVHSCEQKSKSDGWFEVIVGKSMPAGGPAKCLAFVNTHDSKPKRRLFEVLKSQGMQMNQQITFLSDGGDTVRELQFDLNPQAEHLLDWFHITMRITVMNQMAKGLGPHGSELRVDALKELESIKWYLWHGNVFRALEHITDLYLYLDGDIIKGESAKKLRQTLNEFHTYIENNQRWIPNYGERFRAGETISSAFVESTVDQVVSKRMVKKQQMRWSRRGAHLLLQVRTRELNGELRQVFKGWYPAFDPKEVEQAQAA